MVSAEFFDIFGIIAFAIILYIGIRLKRKRTVDKKISYILIAIGILGLFVDLSMVFSAFIF